MCCRDGSAVNGIVMLLRKLQCWTVFLKINDSEKYGFPIDSQAYEAEAYRYSRDETTMEVADLIAK